MTDWSEMFLVPPAPAKFEPQCGAVFGLCLCTLGLPHRWHDENHRCACGAEWTEVGEVVAYAGGDHIDNWPLALLSCEFALLVHDAMLYGLVTGPGVDVDACERMLVEGVDRGYRRPDVDDVVGILSGDRSIDDVLASLAIQKPTVLRPSHDA